MAKKGYRVQDPVTNEVLETFDYATDEQVQDALTESQAAYEEWAARPISERKPIITRISELFLERKDELAKIIGREMGKGYNEAIAEIELSAQIIKYYADHGEKFVEPEELPTLNDGVAYLRRLPIGPLLGIMPWNFPYYQIARFAGPNLMLGNTIILKHADICPTSALAVEQIMHDAGLPKGAYINVFATHDQVSTIIADPRVQGVSLTGSERAGAIVGRQAAENLKKSVLELGGSDAYIVLDSADVKAAARTAWNTRMFNTGQVCSSNKRMIVMSDIYDEFVEELVNLAKNMKPGKPGDKDETTYTPLSSREAAEILDDQVKKAVADGAKVHVGGELSEEGAYFSPAVMTDLPIGSNSYYEEFFGPVANVYKVDSVEEAIALANNSQFGLGGSVFSQDEDKAKQVAGKVNSGMVAVNAFTPLAADLPFGGVKRSGYGRELGPLGMDEFVNKQMYFVSDEK